jgi:hypothetical protein
LVLLEGCVRRENEPGDGESRAGRQPGPLLPEPLFPDSSKTSKSSLPLEPSPLVSPPPEVPDPDPSPDSDSPLDPDPGPELEPWLSSPDVPLTDSPLPELPPLPE